MDRGCFMLNYSPESEPFSLEIDGKAEETPAACDEEEEQRMMKEEIIKGFDVDFSKVRCPLDSGYLPVELDDDFFVKEPQTNVDLLNTLTREALNRYNQEKGTDLEFGKVVKANWHLCADAMFFITFEVIDPSSSDGQPIPYQAQIRYFYSIDTEFILCRPKPCQKKY